MNTIKNAWLFTRSMSMEVSRLDEVSILDSRIVRKERELLGDCTLMQPVV